MAGVFWPRPATLALLVLLLLLLLLLLPLLLLLLMLLIIRLLPLLLLLQAFPDMTAKEIDTKAKALLSKFHWVTGTGYNEEMYSK